jgi:FtsP/CotA-like multicopper oxidase with cupredoxin domain/plastocyanin
MVNERATPAGQEINTALEATPGERILVRVVNAGYVAHRVHSHRQSFQIVATDGRAWPAGGTTDSLWLGPGEKYDLLFTAGGDGPIGIHHHTGEQVGPAPISTAPGPSASESSVVRRYTLYVRDDLRTMPDGATIPVYGFADGPEQPAAVPGPTLTANAGELVEVTLINDRDPTGTGHGFGVPSIEGPISGPAVVRPGETGVYTFRVPQAGSFWYTDPVDPSLRRLGSYGALIVSPPDGSNAVFAGGPIFDKQYTMVLSEFDSAAHEQARLAGGVVAASAGYVPNYFLINGLSYPDTEADPASMVHAERGDKVLIRAINVGQLPHAMHLHGYHFILAARGGAVVPQPPLKDTVLILPGESYDLLFVADQEGMFPFHDHFETANTNNGVWLGGMHTMVATGVSMPPTSGHPHDSAPPSDGTVVALRDNFYSPNQVTVPVGGTVRWQHEGRTEHTVTNLLGYFDSGTVRSGESFSFTFTAPGRYDYFCRFHITNRGVVLVQ